METVGSPIAWVGFLGFVLVMLALDLGVFHKKAHRVTVKEAAVWSAVWVALSGLFALGVWQVYGSARALEFTTGYVIEKSLSVDNIFVFVVIFAAFGIPPIYQHRVLFWGILGALAMRAGFILAGGAFLAAFHWAIYLFGGILAITGIKLLVREEEEVQPERSWFVRAFRRVVPTTTKLDGARFLTRENGRRVATPLLVALVAVEISDVIFAIDSVPAIFAISRDPFIVFTSNIFAILGLRSMYFLLAGIIDRFVYLKVGLAGVLVFVGAKMMLVDVYKVPTPISLGVIALVLGTSVVASLWKTRGTGQGDGVAGGDGTTAEPSAAQRAASASAS